MSGPPSYRVPRTASGQPDLNGFWQALNTANWDLEAHEAAAGPVLQLGAAYAVPPGSGVVIDGPIPYKSDALVMMSEFASAIRTVYMNSTTPPPADTWMGWSNGKWDGDTLVIDSKGFMGGTIGALDPEGTIHVRFLDRAGNYHTDGLHVVERIRRTDADHLSYQATIEDANVYTRPWTISMPLYRRVEPNLQLGEFKCEEFVGDLLYGKYQRK